jgi:hypothetical protein
MLPQVMVKPSDYPFWKGVMKVKDFFKKERILCIWKWYQNKVWGRHWVGQHTFGT